MTIKRRNEKEKIIIDWGNHSVNSKGICYATYNADHTFKAYMTRREIRTIYPQVCK